VTYDSIFSFWIFNIYNSGKDIIEERQTAIQESYDLLNKLSRERQEILQAEEVSGWKM
jgi:hypothetical protein